MYPTSEIRHDCAGGVFPSPLTGRTAAQSAVQGPNRGPLVLPVSDRRKRRSSLSKFSEVTHRELHLMMLDVADALPLILERSGRHTEFQISEMFALLFIGWGLRNRSAG